MQLVGKMRSGRAWIYIAGVILLAGAGFAFTRLDRERYESDPERVKKLAEVPLASEADAAADTTSWPQWRGPNRDGLSPETALLTAWPAGGPSVVWSRAMGRGFSSVAIAGGRLYTMEETGDPTGGTQEAVVCLDASTGREVWRFGYAGQFYERFGSGPRSTPAVDGDFVYAVGPTGIFHCLRAATGEKVWHHDLMQEFQGREMRYGVSFSPLVKGDLVYATPGGPEGNALTAFDKRTGRLVWKALDDPMGYSSPVVTTAAGTRQLLCLTNNALVSLSPTDGKVYWRYPWQTDNGFNIATPITFNNYVFISSAYNKGCVLLEITKGADGSPAAQRVYEHNRMRSYFSSCVRIGNYLYGFDLADLVCMKVCDGEVLWREKGQRNLGKGSVLGAGSHLIVLGEHGKLTLARATPERYQPLASFQVSSNKCWTVPALADGKLYVRDEGRLVCLQVRK